MSIPKETIEHKGETLHWKCFWGGGSYYTNEHNFVFVNKKGEVWCSGKLFFTSYRSWMGQ